MQLSGQFERFTERTRKVLSFAQEEAQRLNHNYIGAGHLLLGLVREGEGIAAQVLGALGIDLDRARAEVEAQFARGDRVVVGEIGLTAEGKRAIEHAVTAARQLNHHYIGTEHLLLGLIAEPNNAAVAVLARLGVDANRLRTATTQRLAQRQATPNQPHEAPDPSPAEPPMAEQLRAHASQLRQTAARLQAQAAQFERMAAQMEGAPTPAAPPADSNATASDLPAPRGIPDTVRLNAEGLRILAAAQQEARRFNHSYIGTEHLLLGLLSAPEAQGGQALASLGIELDKVRTAVEFIIGRGDRIVLGEVGVTPRAKKALTLADDEARRLRPPEVGSAAILLGLVREGEGIGAGVLESLGVNLEKVRAAVLRLLEPDEDA